MMPFLPSPMPERVSQLHLTDGGLRPGLMLSIGLQTTTRTPDGLKVAPTDEVVFAIGPSEEPEQTAFAVSKSMGRYLAKRILEICAE
jgi:hypothetical protein